MISSSPLDWLTPSSLPSSDHWIGKPSMDKHFSVLSLSTIWRRQRRLKENLKKRSIRIIGRHLLWIDLIMFFFFFFHEGESDVWPIRWSYKARRNIIMKGYTIPILHILSLDILKLKWVLNEFLILVIGIPCKLNTSYIWNILHNEDFPSLFQILWWLGVTLSHHAYSKGC